MDGKKEYLWSMIEQIVETQEGKEVKRQTEDKMEAGFVA